MLNVNGNKIKGSYIRKHKVFGNKLQRSVAP